MDDHSAQSFLEACGSRGPLILGVQGPEDDTIAWHVFDRPFAVGGSDSHADLVLKGPDVSARHVYFQLVSGRLFCVDLESRTGVRWGHERGSWGWIRPNQPVWIGNTQVWFKGDPSSEPGSSSPDASMMPVSKSYDQTGLPDLVLEIGQDDRRFTSWRANRPLFLLGSSPSCKIRLESRGPDGVVASILRTPSGIFAVDLLSEKGLVVNRRKTRWARLHDGDSLGVQGHPFRVRCGSKNPRSSSLDRLRPENRSISPAPAPASASVALSQTLGADLKAELSHAVRDFALTNRESADLMRASLLDVVRALTEAQRDQMMAIRQEIAELRQVVQENIRPVALTSELAQSAAPALPLRLVSGASSPPQARPRLDAPQPLKVVEPRPKPASPLLTPPEAEPRTSPDALKVSPTPVDPDFEAKLFERLNGLEQKSSSLLDKMTDALFRSKK